MLPGPQKRSFHQRSHALSLFPWAGSLRLKGGTALGTNEMARTPRSGARGPVRELEVGPRLIDDADGIIAGHGRVAAAKLLGLAEGPGIRLSAMTEAEKRAYVIADNKLALNAGWDEELLALELGELAALELDFDLTITGFEMAEIDLLIGAWP